jgi:hypothetical protein
MLKDGQVVDLVDAWTANMQARIEAHDFGDVEPYMVAVAHASVYRHTRCIAELSADEGVIFPPVIPKKVREPLMRVLNEAIDVCDGANLGRQYDKAKKHGTWPPPRETWIKKEP